MVEAQAGVATGVVPDRKARSVREQLKALVERIERLGEEKDAIAEGIKDVYAEAKGQGFCPKALRTVIRMRRQDTGERREHEAMVEQYMDALGMR